MRDLAIGVMTSVGGDPIEAKKWVESMGIPTMQLGCPTKEYFFATKRQELIRELNASKVRTTLVFCGYDGEDYAHAKETVGFTSPKFHRDRIKRTFEISDLTRDLKVDKIAAHVGFISDDREDSNYGAMIEAIRDIADHCTKNGQTFVFETGQEPAHVLLQFIIDVRRDNLGVNFDPANMILYGSGNPIEALETLRKYVVSVHVKDAVCPQDGDLFKAQRRLGEVDVDIPRFINKLKGIGYKGPLTIEREAKNRRQQTKDILDAKKLLEKLRELP